MTAADAAAEGRLEPADFAAFFRAVHGTPPFTWQQDLVHQVAQPAQMQWPGLLDLPTGAGKTAVLDAAVFLLALDSFRPPPQRRAPRRIVLVVDRRIVVDQAADRARRLGVALQRSDDPTVRRVAAALASLRAGDGPPLVTASLRGGVVRDPSWALRPDVPTIITATVDQVGSRLLFRGYGESDGMKPVHAGLLGSDCLFLLDEVHLSQPFAQTLRAVRRYQGWADTDGPAPRWDVVELSATPGSSTGDRFPRGPLPLDADPVLARRVRARKSASLVAVKQVKDIAKAQHQLVQAAGRETRQLLAQPHLRTVGVVVNRVATARLVAQELRGEVDEDVDVALLTGRMRPLDRESHLTGLLPRIAMGRERTEEGRRLILVATQCIEAGADLDLDGLVTECASLDAVRQRFGRVDRDGLLTEQGTPAAGVVLGPSTLVSADADDPVYGRAAATTWAWLQEQQPLDLGIDALELPPPELLATLVATRPDAPVLLPGHLDAWVQTSPRPTPDPDVGHWLHGLQESQAEVSLVWRADVSPLLLDRWSSSGASGAAADLAVVELCPPSSLEVLGVPLPAARAWLRDPSSSAAPVADVEGAAAPDEALPRDEQGERRALRWAGARSEVVGPRDLRPGDTLVVPASFGGLADGSWDPTATGPVADHATQASWRHRGRAVVRLLDPAGTGDGDGPEDHGDAADREQVLARLAEPATEVVAGSEALVQEVARHLVEVPARDLVVRHVVAARPDGTVGDVTIVLSRKARPAEKVSAGPPDSAVPTVDLDPETSSFTGRAHGLDSHCRGVGDLAGQLAQACGLDEHRVRDLRLAGRLHDIGKADPRFQTWLHDGDEVTAAAAPTLLAKSVVPGQDGPARARARRRSGYPVGTRHELLSLALLREAPLQCWGADDADLVRYLVVSHHGAARPFVPLVPDDDPREVAVEVDGHLLRAGTDHGLERLDSGVADLFWTLVRRYGWWRLASFEAVLRLADHRRSESEAASNA